MPESTKQRVGPSWRVLFDRARTVFWPHDVPDHAPAPALTPHEDWLRRLDRVRDLLEQTRAALVRDGWARGGWFAVVDSTGGVRLATVAESYGLLAPTSRTAGGCLVGTMLRLAEDPDSAPSVADAWSGVDELYEAVHERMGHDSFPPGRVSTHLQRRAKLQALTAWNDEPGRRLDDVLDVVDRAISRTMVAACRPA